MLRRPCHALPFTVVEGRDVVHLVAGEDVRYAIEGAGLETWAPRLLEACDGRRTLDAVIEGVAPERRDAARRLILRLASERVLVDGPPEAAPQTDAGEAPLVFRQDALDLEGALAFNRARLDDGRSWIWSTTGPAARGFVGPLLRPGVGPCLACLLSHFRRLSPAPEVYDALRAHARAGRSVRPVPFPQEALDALDAVVRWKQAAATREVAPAALYRLHVLEVATLEVTTHAVARDVECEECGDASGA